MFDLFVHDGHPITYRRMKNNVLRNKVNLVFLFDLFPIDSPYQFVPETLRRRGPLPGLLRRLHRHIRPPDHGAGVLCNIIPGGGIVEGKPHPPCAPVLLANLLARLHPVQRASLIFIKPHRGYR